MSDDNDRIRRGAREVAEMWTITLIVAFTLGVLLGWLLG